MGVVVAIANQKGGVGETTTAVNLAASLAVAERRVLLVDVDPQGNASSGVGHPSRTVSRGTHDVLLGEADLRSTILGTDLEHLSLVASSPDLAAIELALLDSQDRLTRLRDALANVRDDYDFVIIDCPPSLGLLTVNALVAADTVLVPMQGEYYALEGLSQLVNTIERVRGSHNPELKIWGVLFTMFDPRSKLANEVAETVRKRFHVYNTIIPRNVRLAEAPSHGKPIVLYDATSKGSDGYLKLAREILKDAGEAGAAA